MPSFLRDLRRFSKSNSKLDKSSDSPSAQSSPGPPSNQSSSTLNTSGPESSTPPSTLPSEKSASIPSLNVNNAPPVPSRPAFGNRYSLANRSASTLGLSPRAQGSGSPYAPRVLSISENSWVNQKILLIYGQIADPAQQSFDGNVWVCHHQDHFPATPWPVSDSHFKALVHLQPGPNRLRLDFVSPKLQGASAGNSAHSSWFNINYLPLISSPPLDLVILLASDSPGTFDAVPERQQREGNGLDIAVKKYKMAAYLWQAFTGEQMNRNSFGRRCFRLEEEWQPGSLSHHDNLETPLRNEAKVHIVRTEKTVAELRDLEIAQQHVGATRKDELFTIAEAAVRDYFQPGPGQTRYVSVLLLDAHWDSQMRVIRGHAALGGSDGDIKLAIFGSHALQSYPSCLEEVVPAFADCTRTDTKWVANDLNESGSNWEAANIGIGAHMHEVGHLFGCPHQESGVMLRDYVRLNRTFACRESFSTRTKSPGQRLCLQSDECAWHRLDCLRFRFHPCFRLPSDPSQPTDGSVEVWGVENGNVLITAASGVAWIEIFTQGIAECKTHIEYLEGNGPPMLPRQISITEEDLRSRLPPAQQKKPIQLEVFSGGQGKHVVHDFGSLVSKTNRIKLGNGQFGYRGSKLGYSQLEGSQPQEFILLSMFDSHKALTQIRVFYGMAVDGLEFVYGDSSTQTFGNKGGNTSRAEFNFDTRRGETLLGFYLRAGLWIDGIQILTSGGRKSEIFGNATGGSGHTLIPPRGYSIAGLSGSAGQWVDGFSLIISR